MPGLLARARSLWRGVRHRTQLDAEMREEFEAHIELRAADLVRHGYSHDAAVRQARLEFGSTSHHSDRGAEARGLRRFDDLRLSVLDFKLGARMLVKYPGLAVVGVIAIAFAVAIGAGVMEFATQYLYPRLGMPGADRLVLVQPWDAGRNRTEKRVIHELLQWRNELHAIEEVGAIRSGERNLFATPASIGEPILAAEISPSMLRLASTPALMGRVLVESDERVDAPPVIVVGYDVWQRRFAGDPNIVGRLVRLGDQSFTVVGVMPPGFGFPISHDAWVPLKIGVLATEAGTGRGPAFDAVIGRLAPGSSLAQAQAEIDAATIRGAAARGANKSLRPRVRMFARASVDSTGEAALVLFSINLFIGMLLLLVFGNVALLVFARAATREGEIVVRTALGATRARIVMQLFAEALVLGGVAAVVGLAIAAAGWRWALSIFSEAQGGRLPFWFHSTLSGTTVLYAGLLVLGGAIVAGVLPALKVTKGLDARLRQAAAGSGGFRFGGVWTAVIVAQVAITVAFPVTVFFSWRDYRQVETLDLGVRGSEYLTARIRSDRPRSSASARTLETRLAAAPDIGEVAFTTLLPGMDHPQRRIQAEGDSVATASSAEVAINYFDVLGAPTLQGRGFHAGDLDTAGRAVIVNEMFVRRVLGGRNPIGRRVRYVPNRDVDEDGNAVTSPWLTIVGVAPNLAMTDGSDPKESGAGIYHPLVPERASESFMILRTKGDVRSIPNRIRAIAGEVEPTTRVDQVMPLDQVRAVNQRSTMFFVRILLGVTGVALVLSLAAIYAVMSFTVARRTREIGVRVALGAEQLTIVRTIFARPIRQVTTGVLVGSGIVTVLVRLVLESITATEAAVIVGYALSMLGVCLLACVVPTRRALAVNPTEALRTD
jgi:predicted permease